MLAYIIQFFKKNYFNKNFPLQYRVYIIFFLESYVISFFLAVSNTILGKGMWGITLQWAYVLFCTMVLFCFVEFHRKLQKKLLIFITFGYIPFLFFQTAGYDGTAWYFAIMGVFLLAITFRGKKCTAVVGLNVLLLIACSVIQYLYPDMIIYHESRRDQIIDLVISLVAVAAGISVLTAYIIDAFEAEQTQIKELLIQLEENNKELSDLSNKDALTGAYNRRYLDQFMDRELEICERTGYPLCILMLDLDFFKRVNDTYGHQFGDTVLKNTSAMIQKELRKYDILARYGGEEFLVALSATDIDAGIQIAERICRAVGQHVYPNGVNVTISIGITEYHDGDTIESIIERADTHLYSAKNNGRNRVWGKHVQDVNIQLENTGF